VIILPRHPLLDTSQPRRGGLITLSSLMNALACARRLTDLVSEI
jgi:hypothetical protein